MILKRNGGNHSLVLAAILHSDSLRLSLNAAIVSVRLLRLGKDGVEFSGVAVRLLSQNRTLGSSSSEIPYLTN